MVTYFVFTEYLINGKNNIFPNYFVTIHKEEVNRCSTNVIKITVPPEIMRRVFKSNTIPVLKYVSI